MLELSLEKRKEKETREKSMEEREVSNLASSGNESVEGYNEDSDQTLII